MAKNRKTPDMNLPVWFDGQNINEALFCEEFLQERRIIFANGAFFTPDGRVTDDLPLRGEIYEKLKFCAVNNIPRKITNILEVLKLEAQEPDFPPEQDRIHVANGTLMLNGTFTEGKPAIVRSRLPIAYKPDAPAPVIWLNFLDGLLHAEDIPTLQEFIGYCLIPSNKGQRMMVIKGNGGEGKSQIGAVLSAIFGTNMKDGSIGKISENRFARADLEHILLCVDDDMRMEALRQTNYVKSIVTAQGKMDLERKGKQSYQGWMFARLLAFSIPGFSRDFVKNVLYNPVYMGKIAYGRRRTEKKQGTRNEMHVVEQSEFPVYEGQHEAIISEEDWYLAQEKRKINSFKREKVNNPDHAHILSGILKCPCCGKSMYGNIAKAHSKDKKTRYYYYCKNTVTPTGHECSFRLNIEQTEINKFVAKIISAMVNNPRFVEAIQAKIGTAVDTEDMEKQIAVLQGQLKQAFGTKSRLERQMDTLDINDAHYDRKILDLQRRYDEQYDTIEEIEVQIGELQSQIRSIQQEKISGDNIYRLLLAFDEVYHSATEAEQKEFMKAFIERIEMFPEKRKDGSWIKKIVFNFPVPVDGEEVKELPLETETTVETVVLVSRVKE